MQTEEQFLQAYRPEQYERPSVAADAAVFCLRRQQRESYRQNAGFRLSVLLIRRQDHPFAGCWALPGGFLQPGETLEACAGRKVQEEAGVQPAALLPVKVFSQPGRDVRGWIISQLFVSVLRGAHSPGRGEWFDMEFAAGADGTGLLTLTNEQQALQCSLHSAEVPFGGRQWQVTEPGALAFDHGGMLACALEVLRERVRHFEMIFDFLPEHFTLAELQEAQETIAGQAVKPANFRRKAGLYVEETEACTQGAGHRPARYYKRRESV